MESMHLDKAEKTILLTALRLLRSYSTNGQESANISNLEAKIEDLIPDITVVTYDGEDFFASGEKVTPFL